MPERVFCIDFGSAFTKVSFRQSPTSRSDWITDSRLRYDELKICVPSVIAVDERDATPTLAFGEEAENLPRSPKKVKLHRDWKRTLLAQQPRPTNPATSAESNPAPLEALLASNRFAELAASFGVSPRSISHLRAIVTHAAGLAGVAIPPAKPVTEESSDLIDLATNYFRWLRKRTIEAGAKLRTPVGDLEKLPTRVTVPAFGPPECVHQHPGNVVLLNVLRDAGWPVAEYRPLVTEPEANALGVITQGHNGPGQREMLGNGLLATTLNDGEYYGTYRAIVIDVGAFTTDFASLTFRSTARKAIITDVHFDQVTHSVAWGVSNLDSAVLAVLSVQKMKHLKDVATANEWMDFRPRVYTEGLPIQLGDERALEVNAGREASKIKDAILQFTRRLDAEAEAFVERLGEDVPFKELILTGGGNTIPAIQNALINGAERHRSVFRKIHLPATTAPGQQKAETDLTRVVTLNGKLTRGATALGGTSRYFDFGDS